MSVTPPRRLTRSTHDRRIGSVAAGVAEYLHLDPPLVGIAFAVMVLVGGGFPLVLYVLLWVIMPDVPIDAAGGGVTPRRRPTAAAIVGVLVALMAAWLWTTSWMWHIGGDWMGSHMGRFGFGMMPFGGLLIALIIVLLRDSRSH